MTACTGWGYSCLSCIPIWLLAGCLSGWATGPSPNKSGSADPPPTEPHLGGTRSIQLPPEYTKHKKRLATQTPGAEILVKIPKNLVVIKYTHIGILIRFYPIMKYRFCDLSFFPMLKYKFERFFVALPKIHMFLKNAI